MALEINHSLYRLRSFIKYLDSGNVLRDLPACIVHRIRNTGEKIKALSYKHVVVRRNKFLLTRSSLLFTCFSSIDLQPDDSLSRRRRSRWMNSDHWNIRFSNWKNGISIASQGFAIWFTYMLFCFYLVCTYSYFYEQTKCTAELVGRDFNNHNK